MIIHKESSTDDSGEKNIEVLGEALSDTLVLPVFGREVRFIFLSLLDFMVSFACRISRLCFVTNELLHAFIFLVCLGSDCATGIWNGTRFDINSWISSQGYQKNADVWFFMFFLLLSYLLFRFLFLFFSFSLSFSFFLHLLNPKSFLRKTILFIFAFLDLFFSVFAQLQYFFRGWGGGLCFARN